MLSKIPQKQGLYDPANEHDSCGIGFVADIKGKKSYEIIQRGLDVLVNMTHRGAEGADNRSGDGAGILMQIPHEFYAAKVSGLPALGNYGTGLVFLPKDKKQAEFCQQELVKIVEQEGLKVIGWRDVPTDDSHLGEIARKAEPEIKQVFISTTQPPLDSRLRGNDTSDDLEKKLYLVRKQIEYKIRNSELEERSAFYIPTLSCRTIGYKGMLQPVQVQQYFLDLQDKSLTSAIALVHSRFSTNTFPSWDLAQPFRMIAHNGEINTVKGNRFWMQAREAQLASELFGDDLKKLLPTIEPGKSDSASFDNVLEMLVMCGRSLPHALAMMIPESWNDKNPISDDLKAFYEYHSAFMEPWDGPASMVFTDGRYIGGTLDRNGLRPSRYVITKSGLIVMGSEVGVQVFPAEEVQSKGRLMPGKILLVDTAEGRIIPDEEVKKDLIDKHPYRQWAEQNRINLVDLPKASMPENVPNKYDLRRLQIAFGYSAEDVQDIIMFMAEKGQEPTGSMGTDTPLAVLSKMPQRLFNYFKQHFAQV
ncbi:MAG: glutamate synthase central domain-containing protein, partial [Candidatus Margulisiibacteriota bacterium]